MSNSSLHMPKVQIMHAGHASNTSISPLSDGRIGHKSHILSVRHWESGHSERQNAISANSDYFKRTLVRAVGTAQILPALPNE